MIFLLHECARPAGLFDVLNDLGFDEWPSGIGCGLKSSIVLSASVRRIYSSLCAPRYHMDAL